MPGRALMTALALTCIGATGGPAEIGKPRPAPPGPSTMPPLRPAVIDNTLAIGGDDIKAKKVESGMTVEVPVKGRGPYPFVVDRGAPTAAVVTRSARDLQMPLGSLGG